MCKTTLNRSVFIALALAIFLPLFASNATANTLQFSMNRDFIGAAGFSPAPNDSTGGLRFQIRWNNGTLAQAFYRVSVGFWAITDAAGTGYMRNWTATPLSAIASEPDSLATSSWNITANWTANFTGNAYWFGWVNRISGAGDLNYTFYQNAAQNQSINHTSGNTTFNYSVYVNRGDNLSMSLGGAAGPYENWTWYVENLTGSDTTKPACVSSSLVPTVYQNGFQTWLNSTCTDDTSIANVTTSFDGVNFTPTNGSSNVYFLRLNGVSAGVHYWQQYASDAAGNANSTANLTFTVARAPVNATLFVNSSPINRSLTGNVFNITLTTNASEGTSEILYNVTGLANVVLNLSVTNTTNYSFFNWTNSTVLLTTGRFNQTQNYSAAARAMSWIINTTPNFTDIQSPNSTGEASWFNFTFNDDVELLSWIFSTNYTDNWLNDSLNITSGVPNQTISVVRGNAPRGTTFWYGWRVYGNDTLGNFIDSNEIMAVVRDSGAVEGEQGGGGGGGGGFNFGSAPPSGGNGSNVSAAPLPQDTLNSLISEFDKFARKPIETNFNGQKYSFPQVAFLITGLFAFAWFDTGRRQRQTGYSVEIWKGRSALGQLSFYSAILLLGVYSYAFLAGGGLH